MKSLNDFIRERKTTRGLVFSQAITKLFGPIRSEISSRPRVAEVVRRFGRAAFRWHDIDFGIAVVLRGESELRPVGGEAREGSVTWSAGNSAGNAAFFSDSVKFACVTKNDLAAVGSWKAQQPRGVGQILGRDERHHGKREQTSEQGRR